MSFPLTFPRALALLASLVAALALAAAPALATEECDEDCDDEPPVTVVQPAQPAPAPPPAPAAAAPAPPPAPAPAAAPETRPTRPTGAVRGERARSHRRVTRNRARPQTLVRATAAEVRAVPRGGVQAGLGGTAPEPARDVLPLAAAGGLLLLAAAGGGTFARLRRERR